MTMPEKKVRSSTPTINKSVKIILIAISLLAVWSSIIYIFIHSGEWPEFVSFLPQVYSNVLFVLFSIYMFCSSIYSIIKSTVQIMHALRLNAEGLDTMGVFLAAWEEKKRSGLLTTTSNYYLVFEFIVMGVRYRLRQEISKKEFTASKPEGNVRVKYVQNNPLNARMMGIAQPGM